MKTITTSLFTICGLEELEHHSTRGVTHVLSILDPDWPEPPAFAKFDFHHRTTLKFHDVIEQGPGLVLPQPQHVEAILEFGKGLVTDATVGRNPHLLVHCHMGVSRSTAAMAILMVQSSNSESEESVFSRLLELRPQAWPNSRMIGFADDLLGRRGNMLDALGTLYATQLVARPEMAEFMRAHGRGRELDLAKRRRIPLPQ